MNAFTIKDLENLSGIKAHTIRIWEQRYSFLKPQRSETNIRYYSNVELKTVLNISLLNKYGYKISHINKMSEAEMVEKIILLSNEQAQLERMVNDLIKLMVDLDVEKFEQLLESYIKQNGIEKSISHIIFPFLERIGILWLTNHINPAQEHLVSNIIRQKLLVGIDSISINDKANKLFLLFLPEGEYHELGLLFLYYLLKIRGIRVLYLGANVPWSDVQYVAKLKKPDFLYSHLTSVAHNFNFDKFLLHLSNKLPEFPMVISGQLLQYFKKKPTGNVKFIKSFSEVIDFISVI